MPEAELPYSMQSIDFNNFVNNLDTSNKEFISGVWNYDDGNLYNSLINLNTGKNYNKTHLVPFGEYIPFIASLRGIIDFFDMPMSSLSMGHSNQELLEFRNFKILGMICFDIAFPLSYLKEIKEADFIVNISNDTWFGSSYGPYQHLQIVRARALESNKCCLLYTSDAADE